MWQEEKNFEIHPTSVLLCYEKAFILFDICEAYSGVMWNSCKRNSGTQLSQSVSDTKQEITKFVTVLLHSQTGATYDDNAELKFEHT